MDVSIARFQALCAAFRNQRIVVIGDLMLDHLITGDAGRISPEAPIPIVNFIAESFSPGGAGNVARNLSVLGARVDLFGVVGDDVFAESLRQSLAAYGLAATGALVEPGRPTTVKSRITAQRYQIVRVDREVNVPIRPEVAARLHASCLRALPGAAAVIVADYAKGVVDQPLIDALVTHARRLDIPVCVDPKPSHPLNLAGCAVLTPNRKEAFELAGLADPGCVGSPTSDPGLCRAIEAIRQRHDPAILLVTLSEAGLLLVERSGRALHIPTVARQVYDVTGAGDTVIAAFVLARAAGASSYEAAAIANHAAGVVVGKTGTAAVTPPELLDWIAKCAG